MSQLRENKEDQKVARFNKVDDAQYDRVNDLLRDRVYFTAREWAIARLCGELRTETGVPMTMIGEQLPDLIPYMEDEYTPQAVNEARKTFDEKVRMAMATALYGAMADFYTADELDEVMYEATEIARFLLEIEGAGVDVESEHEAEDALREAMRAVRRAAAGLRDPLSECPHCGESLPSTHDSDGRQQKQHQECDE